MSNIPILPLFFLLLISFPTKPLSLRASSSDTVVDTSGKELQPGVLYQILPAIRGAFTLASYQNDSCPLVVVHAQQKAADSLKLPPVTFLPADPSAHVIQTSTNVNVKFSTTSSPKPCGSSMVWRLLKRITEARFISTDGVEGNPNMNTYVNWFMIEKLSAGKTGGGASAYKLRFCPTEVCKCSVTCSDLGIYVADDKKRYLGLADKLEPISVVFKRTS